MDEMRATEMPSDARGAGRARHGVAGLRGAIAAIAIASLSAGTPAGAAVTVPGSGDNLMPDNDITVIWDPLDGCGAVDIDIYQGRTLVCGVAAGEPDDGSFVWTVDDCGLDPACNVRIRVGCGTEEAWSERFAIEGILLQQVVPGDRTVELTWGRLDADTLGAGNLDPAVGESVFGGYNVWRRVFDNQLTSERARRFSKIRSYDVQAFGSDTSAVGWNFLRESLPIGPVEAVDEDGDTFTETWTLAQTFSVDRAMTVCSARIFLGEVESSWEFETRIVRLSDGIPDLDDVVAEFDSTRTGTTAFTWLIFDFAPGAQVMPGEQYALVIDATPLTSNVSRVFWTLSSYDAEPSGNLQYQVDTDPGWVSDENADFAFVLSETTVNGCQDVFGQRLAGTEERRFRDAEDVLAFERDEDLILHPIEVPGPYNGFQLEYAVTAYYRAALASGNIERPSACEDTLFLENGFPEGVQPSAPAVWPEIIFPQSQQPGGSGLLLKNVYPVPNPYVRDVDSVSFPRWERPGERRIDFVNLPRGAKIRITSVSAETVRVLEHTEDHGTTRWDLRNSSGEIVSSGVYLWFVTAPSGEKKNGQLIIVR